MAGRLNSGVRPQMQHFDIVNLYNRGLASFDALSPLERDVFVIHDLNLWYEMEGTFEDYLLGGSYTAQLNWLADTLHRIGDLESTAILSELLPLTWEQRDTVATLSENFYSLMESRARLLEQYLHQHGAAVAW